MFGKRITLFRLFGFTVHLDASWVFIALLVTWSLAAGYFPQNFPGLGTWTYWAMGVAGAVGLFASIIFHEFWHSLVARHYGLPMKGITLFLFGGVSEMTREPDNPKTEFLMAVAGPISSVVLGFFCYGLYLWSGHGDWPVPAVAIIGYLAFINWLLAAFNLLPAFPLDGGRILRSGLWRWKKDLPWATRKASGVGSAFGMVLMIFGAISFFAGNVIGGLWYFIIGLFLRGAAQASYRRVLTRDVLGGKTVADLMHPDPVTVDSRLNLREMVEDYLYRYHHKMFPVVEDGRVIGCIGSREIKSVAREEWGERRVSEVASGCGEEQRVSPELSASRALARMNRTGHSRLLVMEGDRLVGVITLKDILGLVSMLLELGEGDEG